MTRFSIRKLGSEYVIFADDQSILRTASRRKAAKLVVVAEELLSVQLDESPPLAHEGDQAAVKPAMFLDAEEGFPY
jgi:hypothetical protein